MYCGGFIYIIFLIYLIYSIDKVAFSSQKTTKLTKHGSTPTLRATVPMLLKLSARVCAWFLGSLAPSNGAVPP